MIVNSSKFNFKDVVDDLLKTYNGDVVEQMTAAIDEVSKEAVQKLKEESRAEFGAGKYAKGWTRKIENKRLIHSATVYGKSGTYQLAHLLEHGHVTRNGTGRRYNDTPAHIHIEPVERWAVAEAFDRTVTKLERMTR